MRFYSLVMSNPRSPRYGEHVSVHRRYERNGSEVFEWWDRENKRWEFDREFLKDIYVDGPDDYDEITRDEALTLLQKWGVEDAEKVLGGYP